jgi:hypothetical protein
MICFDTITASKIKNDLDYCDYTIKSKTDSLEVLKSQINSVQAVNQKYDSVLFNKKKIDFIQYATIVVLTVINWFSLK